MNRRTAIASLTIPTLFGGLSVVNLSSRSALAKELERDSGPFQIESAYNDLSTEPEKAGEEIKIFFTEACLNSSAFIDYLTSEACRLQIENLPKDQDKELFIQSKFFTYVVSPELILNKTNIILKEVDKNISLRWKDTCKEIMSKWGERLSLNYSVEDLNFETNQLMKDSISKELDIILRDLTSLGRNKSNFTLSEKFLSESFLLLMTTFIQPEVAPVTIPVFAYEAIKVFAQYTKRELIDNVNESKYSVSSRLSNLAVRVGDQLSVDLKKRIDGFHAHRQKAMQNVTQNIAKSEVHLLWG